MLIQMHGQPGSGKSTLARAAGRALGAVVVDKDLLATGAIRAGVPFAEAGAIAYSQLWLLVPSLLAQGHGVVIDSPCFWPQIEENGRRIAAEAGVTYRMIEVTCDEREIDRRLATRERLESNPAARGAPATSRPGTYTPTCERLVIDGTLPVGKLVDAVRDFLAAQPTSPHPLAPSPDAAGEGELRRMPAAPAVRDARLEHDRVPSLPDQTTKPADERNTSSDAARRSPALPALREIGAGGEGA